MLKPELTAECGQLDGEVVPASDRAIAVRRRAAFFGDRSRCAVSSRLASSSAGISAMS